MTVVYLEQYKTRRQSNKRLITVLGSVANRYWKQVDILNKKDEQIAALQAEKAQRDNEELKQQEQYQLYATQYRQRAQSRWMRHATTFALGAMGAYLCLDWLKGTQ